MNKILIILAIVLMLDGCSSGALIRGNAMTVRDHTTHQNNWTTNYSNDQVTGVQRIVAYNGPVHVRCAYDKYVNRVKLDVYLISKDITGSGGRVQMYFGGNKYEMLSTEGKGYQSIFLSDSQFLSVMSASMPVITYTKLFELMETNERMGITYPRWLHSPKTVSIDLAGFKSALDNINDMCVMY